METVLVNKLSELSNEFVSIIYFVTSTLKDNWKPYPETALIWNNLKIIGGKVLLLAKKRKTLNNNDLNQVPGQRFSLKQCMDNMIHNKQAQQESNQHRHQT